MGASGRGMFKTVSLLAALSLAACMSSSDQVGDDAVTAGADQQLAAGGGKGDSAAKSTDPRLVNCHLDDQAFGPAFASRNTGAFDEAFAKIGNYSAFAGDC